MRPLVEAPSPLPAAVVVVSGCLHLMAAQTAGQREGFTALTSVFPKTKVLAFTPSQAGRHFQVNAPRREVLICANLSSAVSW